MRNYRYIFLFFCFVPLLLFRDFTPNNELKYLSIVDEALRDGHFFTFWNHGSLYADKPPLYFWIMMLGKWLLGEHSMFFIGLFSFVPALAILMVMDQWTKQEMPPHARCSSQFALMTSGLFAGAAIVLRMDMLMCLFIVLALHSFYLQYTGKGKKREQFLLPVYIFMAIFTKGPVGLLVPLLSIAVFLGINRKIKTFGRYLGWKQWGILIFMSILWFAGVYVEGGKEYLNNLLFHQTVNRAVDSFHHKAPFWYYAGTIWYSLAPWSLFYILLIIRGIQKHQLDTDLKKFFLTIIVTTFIALSIFSSKLDIYLLPIFPFIAYLSFLLFRPDEFKYPKLGLYIPALLLVLTFPGLLIAKQSVVIPIPVNIWIYVSAFLLSAGAAVCLYFLFHRHLLRATNALAIGLLLSILIGGVAISGLNPYIGFKELSLKAKTIAEENNIKSYYFYKFRSGENMDSYLKKEIVKIDIPEIVSLSEKQNFILFVKDKELQKNALLKEITDQYLSYKIGDYKIILFKLN